MPVCAHNRTQASDFAARVGLPLAKLAIKMEGGNLLPNGAGVCIVSDRVLLVTYRWVGARGSQQQEDWARCAMAGGVCVPQGFA